MKRILAIIIASFFLLSTFIPFCFADYSSQPRGFWDVALYKLCQAPDAVSVDIGGFSLNLGFISGNSKLNSHLSENICSDSSDHLHHADSLNEWQGNNTLNEHGSYAYATCKFCGKTFKYYSDDLRQDYQTYLHDNNLDNDLCVTPSTDNNPSGFLWRPTLDDIEYLESYHYGHALIDKAQNISLPHRLERFDVDWVDYHSDLTVERYYTGGSEFCSEGITRIKFYSPFSGVLIIKAGTVVLRDGVVTLSNGSVMSFNGTVSADVSRSVSYGDLVDVSWSLAPVSNVPETSYTGQFVIPCFSVYGLSSPSLSVPSSITINNITYPVVDINFNSRTVHVEGDTKIEYGDTEIKIYEGDTVIQTINYIIENDDPGSDPGNGDDSSTPVDPGTVATGSDVSGGSGCCEQCALLLRQVNSYLLQIQTLVDQINDKLGPESDNYMEGIYNLLVEINTALDNLPTEPHKDYEAKLTTISNQLANIWGDLDTIKTSLSAVQTNTATTNQKLDTVHTDLQAVLSELQTQRGILSQILSVLRDILSHVITIDKNVDELRDEESTDTFITTVVNKFGFVNQVYSITFQMFKDITNDAVTSQDVSNGVIPVGDISSGHATSYGGSATAPQVLCNFPSVTWNGVNFGGYTALDLSWYAPYKPTVDAILSGFFWLSYIYMLFKKLPGIIHGESMSND